MAGNLTATLAAVVSPEARSETGGETHRASLKSQPCENCPVKALALLPVCLLGEFLDENLAVVLQPLDGDFNGFIFLGLLEDPLG